MRGSALNDCRSLRRLADVQRVEDGSAEGTISMSVKQMQSLGCPTFFDLQLAEKDMCWVKGWVGFNVLYVSVYIYIIVVLLEQHVH